MGVLFAYDDWANVFFTVIWRRKKCYKQLLYPFLTFLFTFEKSLKIKDKTMIAGSNKFLDNFSQKNTLLYKNLR